MALQLASSTIVINTSTGSVSDAVSSGPQAPTAGTLQPTVDPIELTGTVFSYSALELSWNRDVIPDVTYDIFQNGELIRANSLAISQFESGLLPDTSYCGYLIKKEACNTRCATSLFVSIE